MIARPRSMSDGRPDLWPSASLRARLQHLDATAIEAVARWSLAAGAAVLVFLAGYQLGAHRVGADAHRTATREGACIAMDMAMAHGYLDETGRRVLSRSLAGAGNPLAHRFAGGHKALVATCNEIAGDR